MKKSITIRKIRNGWVVEFRNHSEQTPATQYEKDFSAIVRYLEKYKIEIEADAR